jgi:pilus assembly protein CpaC
MIMKSRNALLAQFFLMVFALAFFGTSSARSGDGTTPSAGNQNPQIEVPPSGSPETLRVFEGRSLVLNTGEPIKRISVTNDQIASAIIVSPTQVLIHGLKSGTITLILWNEQEQLRSFDLQVQSVPMNLEPLRATLSRILPDQDINVSQSGSSVVLTGTVPSAAIVERANALAKTQTENVVNLLQTPPIDDVFLLEVKFAEVSRTVGSQLGLNIFSTGALNTPGAISTQQFSPPRSGSINGAIGDPLRGYSTSMTLSDILNVFVFRPDLNLGLTIRALQQKGLLQTLAEPNLLSLGGKEASFLAGGEFPVPIIQGTSGNQSVSVQFKEFGIRLKFVANPNPDGTINLHVAPEVSALDYANAVTLAGFLIPALSTRRAETEVQLKDGQSFAIAGLMDNRVTKTDDKIPWLGDVPILGKLFRSTTFQKGNSELLVVVTPRIVKPLQPGQTPPMPSFPVPFMDQEKSGQKGGEVPLPRSPG